MPLYLCDADIIEEMPSYTFVIEARNLKEAKEEARKEVLSSYGEEADDTYITEVETLEEVKSRLLV